MNKYINIILEKLINKYERSKLSLDINTKNIKITLKFDAKNMNDYVGEDSYKYEKYIEGAVLELEKQDFIIVDRYQNIIKKVTLNINKIDDIYKYLNKESKNDITNKYLNLLNCYQDKGDLVNKFCLLIKDKINNNKPYKSYFKNELELEEILIVLENIETQEEISKRAFSAKYLKNSKRLESIEGKIKSIILELNNDLTYEDIFSYFNIVTNQTYIYLRGNILIKINNQIIDTSETQEELVLSSNWVNNLDILALKASKVITIENLTTFYDYPLDNDTLLIYLGGFHNEVRRKFLLKLKEFKNLSFYHTGDIDAGGFYILNHLRRKTGIDFKPINMDILTLKKYSNYTIKLTKEDRKRLERLKEIDEFKEIVTYMLDNNVKLEQENII